MIVDPTRKSRDLDILRTNNICPGQVLIDNHLDNAFGSAKVSQGLDW